MYIYIYMYLYMYILVLVFKFIVYVVVCIILTAGKDMQRFSDYSLMSTTVLQISGTLLDRLLFTGPACEYIHVSHDAVNHANYGSN